MSITIITKKIRHNVQLKALIALILIPDLNIPETSIIRHIKIRMEADKRKSNRRPTLITSIQSAECKALKTSKL